MDLITELCKSLNQESINLTVKCFSCGEELTVLFHSHNFEGINNIDGGCVEFLEDRIKIYHKECW